MVDFLGFGSWLSSSLDGCLLVSYDASPWPHQAVGQVCFTIRFSFEETAGKQTGDGRARRPTSTPGACASRTPSGEVYILKKRSQMFRLLAQECDEFSHIPPQQDGYEYPRYQHEPPVFRHSLQFLGLVVLQNLSVARNNEHEV